MTARVTRWTLLGLGVLTFAVMSATTAYASHYRIAVLEIFDEDQLAALSVQGVETTEDFVAQTQTRAGRSELSQQTGISEMEVLVFARLCELLQIEGVGPRAAQLLRAAGVVSAADLASRDPAELVERVVAVNAVDQLTGIDPNLENVVAWIAAAGRVPYHVE